MQGRTAQHGLIFPLQAVLIDRNIRGSEYGNHAGQPQRLCLVNAYHAGVRMAGE